MIKFEKLKGNIYFTADLHMYHKKMIEYRNFEDEEKMSENIINMINKTVGERDTLIHVGDFCFGTHHNIPVVIEQLKCKNIIFIEGNHDHNLNKYVKVIQIGYFQYNYTQIVASHYPMLHWSHQNYGSINVHGHLHGDESSLLKTIHDVYKSLDVGIDNYYKLYGEYGLFTIDDIINKTNDKQLLIRHDN